MNSEEYRNFKNSIEVCLKTGDNQLLNDICSKFDEDSSLKEKIIKELEYEGEYIVLFTDKEQVEIVSKIVEMIKNEQYSAFKAAWILIYVSEEALVEILRNADNRALVKIMGEIQKNIQLIGKRFCDTDRASKSTNFFSRIGERIEWLKLYKKCEKNFKK